MFFIILGESNFPHNLLLNDHTFYITKIPFISIYGFVYTLIIILFYILIYIFPDYYSFSLENPYPIT